MENCKNILLNVSCLKAGHFLRSSHMNHSGSTSVHLISTGLSLAWMQGGMIISSNTSVADLNILINYCHQLEMGAVVNTVGVMIKKQTSIIKLNIYSPTPKKYQSTCRCQARLELRSGKCIIQMKTV